MKQEPTSSGEARACFFGEASQLLLPPAALQQLVEAEHGRPRSAPPPPRRGPGRTPRAAGPRAASGLRNRPSDRRGPPPAAQSGPAAPTAAADPRRTSSRAAVGSEDPAARSGGPPGSAYRETNRSVGPARPSGRGDKRRLRPDLGGAPSAVEHRDDVPLGRDEVGRRVLRPTAASRVRSRAGLCRRSCPADAGSGLASGTCVLRRLCTVGCRCLPLTVVTAVDSRLAMSVLTRTASSLIADGY